MNDLLPCAAEPQAKARLFASHIQNLRGSMYMSRIQFGQMLRVSPETIRQWECRKRYPSRASMEKIAVALCYAARIYAFARGLGEAEL